MVASYDLTFDAAEAPETGGTSSIRARLMAGMPRDIARILTEDQLEAIERALEERTTRRPRVDVRLSIPLLRRRCFFVLLAGLEGRSPERRRQDRLIHRLWTLANMSVLSFALLLLIPAILGLSHMVVALAVN